MKAVILCGGQGTRIREASDSLPKPMLPIGNKPMVWHIMKSYAAHGVKEFVLCLGYKGWLIKEFFLNSRAMTNDVTVSLGANPSVTIQGAVSVRWTPVPYSEPPWRPSSRSGARAKARKLLCCSCRLCVMPSAST